MLQLAGLFGKTGWTRADRRSHFEQHKSGYLTYAHFEFTLFNIMHAIILCVWYFDSTRDSTTLLPLMFSSALCLLYARLQLKRTIEVLSLTSFGPEGGKNEMPSHIRLASLHYILLRAESIPDRDSIAIFILPSS